MPEQRPSPRFLAGLGAVVIAVVWSVWRSAQLSILAPDWAPCLVPASLSVVWGILAARSRWIATSGPGRAPSRMTRPWFRGSVIGGLVLAAAGVALVERVLADYTYPHAPLWLRVSGVIFVITFGVSELGGFIIVDESATDTGHHSWSEEGSRRTRG